MKYIVTGGAGFIGSHIVEELSQQHASTTNSGCGIHQTIVVLMLEILKFIFLRGYES